MFLLYADKNQLCVRQREPITSGSVNVYPVRFEFSEDWEGLTRKAVFRAGRESRTVLLDENGSCTVPWEVLNTYCPNTALLAGVYGSRTNTALPTVWASLGKILEGAALGADAHPPTPDLWLQELAEKGDALKYDGLMLSLMSGETPLSTVRIEGGGSGGGGGDHRQLTGREAAEQHPVGAISGLAEALSRIPEPAEALTNLELEELLK